MVQLKSYTTKGKTKSDVRFNSCMVQLKFEWVWVTHNRQKSFNSCMVQLKFVGGSVASLERYTF